MKKKKFSKKGKSEKENLNKEAMSLGKTIAKSIISELNLGKGKGKAVAKSARSMIVKDGFLAKLFKGKDLIANRDKLTKEEVIVGFFHALVTGNKRVAKALSEGTAADGGFLFPDEFLAELVRGLEEPTRMRSLVRVIPMRRDILQLPSLADGPKLTWTAENAAKSTTTAHFGQVTLTARKLTAILYASDELIEDSTEIDVVNLIIDLFSEEVGIEEDRVIIAGNGTTEPSGFTQATLGSQAVDGNISFDDMIDLFYLLPQKYRRNATWVFHSENIRELRKLKDSQNRYIWIDSPVPETPSTILGRPVLEMDWVPVDEIYFGDLRRAYFLGDRKRMTVKISTDTTQAFTQDMTAIRVVARIAGIVALPEALKKLTSIP